MSAPTRPAPNYLCATIRVLWILAVALLALTPIATSAQPVTVVEGPDVSNRFASLAIVDGHPAIVYSPLVSPELRFVRATDATGSAWGAQVSPVPGVNAHYATLLVVDGFPAIAYYFDGKIWYVRATNADGSAPWGTPVEVVTTSHIQSFFIAITIVNGNPAIAYHQNSDKALYYVRADNATGSSWGSPVLVDDHATNESGKAPSLSVVDGRPAIAYAYRGPGPVGELRYVRSSDANGASWGSPRVVDSDATRPVGHYNTLRVISGNPAISYRRYHSDGVVTYARASDAAGDTWEEPVEVVPGTADGYTYALEMVDEHPAIAYISQAARQSGYVRATDAIGASWGEPVSPDPAQGSHGASGFAVVAGRPAISYVHILFDNANQPIFPVKYVRAADAQGASWEAPTTPIVVSGNGIVIEDGDPAAPDNGSDFGDLLAELGSETSTFSITRGGVVAAICDISFDGAGATTDPVSGHFSLAFEGSQPSVGTPVIVPEAGLGFTVTFAPKDADDNSTVAVSIAYDEDQDCSSIDGTFGLQLDGRGLLDFGDLPGGSPDYTAETSFPTGARHAPVGPLLGQSRDAELDGQPSDDAGLTAATGDDGDAGGDDEDGVTFFQPDPDGLAFARFIQGQTVSVEVELGGTVSSAYLHAWLDANADGTFGAGEQVIVNELLNLGPNVVSFSWTSPATSNLSGLRFRVTSAPASQDFAVSYDGLLPDGEVEDYWVDLRAEAEVDLVMPGASGRVEFNGTDLIVYDDAGRVTFQAPIVALPSPGVLDIVGNAADNTLTIGQGVLEALEAAGLVLAFDGTASGANGIVIETGAGTLDLVDHRFDSNSDGSVSIDAGSGPVEVLTYLNLAPIADNMSAVARTFDFTDPGDEVVTFSAGDDGAVGNGVSFIDSDIGSEATSFANPTTSISITSSGGGSETFHIGSVDTPIPGTFASLSVDGGTGDDVFVVTPVADYSISIDGGTEITCDALTFDLSNGAVIETITNVAGTGTVTFQAPYRDITFTGIESVGNADISVSLNYGTLTATDLLSAGTELVVTATNDGPEDGNCLTVLIDPPLTEWLAGAEANPGAGTTFSSPDTWVIPSLPVGESATLELTGFVTTAAPAVVNFTSSTLQDVNEANNTASLMLSAGFAFPPGTQVNSAIYVPESFDLNTDGIPGDETHSYEQLVVAVFQGAPGIEGAVWCKIPAAITASAGTPIWPPAGIPSQAVGNLWRPCSGVVVPDDTGTPLEDESRQVLPFPLHTNDLFLDRSGRLWLASWGSTGLYRSEDAARTWQPAWPGLGAGSDGGPHWANVYSVAEDASGGILYISAQEGLGRSLNGGVTWQAMGTLPDVASGTPWSLVAHPTESGVVYAGTFGNGVYLSTNFGFDWEALDRAIPVDLNQALLDDAAGHIFDLDFSPDNNDFLFAGTGSGVYRLELAGTGLAGAAAAWEFMGAEIELSDGSEVIPEVRAMAFARDDDAGDADGNADDELVIGTWGFGALIDNNPTRGAVGPSGFAELILRGENVSFIAVGSNGQLSLGTESGSFVQATLAPSATATATQPPPAADLPEGFGLAQNYPNPFNPVTTIGFSLPEVARVRLSVFDSLGREVALLEDRVMEPGQHETRFDSRGLPTGTYLYRLSTPWGALSRTLVFMK